MLLLRRTSLVTLCVKRVTLGGRLRNIPRKTLGYALPVFLACGCSDTTETPPPDSDPTAESMVQDSEPADDSVPTTTEFGAPRVVINEFLASNRGSLTDPDWSPTTGDSGPPPTPDWIELFNTTQEDVELAGWWLTDDLSDPEKWQIPTGIVIPARGFVLIFADSDTEEGPLHASFNLDAAGGDIGLTATPLYGSVLVDSVEGYGQQAIDVSLARTPDGGQVWEQRSSPTPGAPNGAGD